MFTVKENNLCLSFNRKLSNYLKKKKPIYPGNIIIWFIPEHAFFFLL